MRSYRSFDIGHFRGRKVTYPIAGRSQDQEDRVARDEIPAPVIIAELVCPAALLALNFSFLASLPVEFGSGFQLIPMVLAEAVILLSLGLIAHVCLFVLFPQVSRGSVQGVLWSYIFGAIWVRLLAFCSVLAFLCGGLNWYVHWGMGGAAPGPFIWGAFSACLALAAWRRVRQLRDDDFFRENDERIRRHEEWFKTRFASGMLIQKKRRGLRDMPSIILLLMVFLLMGLIGLVVGITDLGRGDVSAVMPLIFGAVLTVFPFYWLALLASQLRGKALSVVVILEKDLSGLFVRAPDVLSGQRTVLLLTGLFAFGPLAVSSVQATWGGFVFAIVAGVGGFVGLHLAYEKLVRRQKAEPMAPADYERVRQRVARRGCDYGLILLVGGLLVIALASTILAWGTGVEPVGRRWEQFAFPLWAWLILAGLSSWYERVVRPVWPDTVDPTPGLRLTEIITWPFQLFFFLNPWEVLIRLRKEQNRK